MKYRKGSIIMSKFREVAGKVAIVTGAAMGIGYSAAEALAKEGIHVVLADVQSSVHDAWAKIKEQCPENEGFAMEVDVTKEAQVKALMDATVEKFGRIDILYSNAGINGGECSVCDLTEDRIDKVFNVNFKGMVFCFKHAGEQMKKQKYGTIVATGSWYGKEGHANSGLYGASKAAVHTLVHAMALEMAPYGVTVNAVCPALADSEMHWVYVRKEAAETGVPFETLKEKELDGVPLHRLGTGADSAGAIMWLASESGSYVTGQLINVNGGMFLF